MARARDSAREIWELSPFLGTIRCCCFLWNFRQRGKVRCKTFIRNMWNRWRGGAYKQSCRPRICHDSCVIVIQNIAYHLRLSGGRNDDEDYSSMRRQEHTTCSLICITAHPGAYKGCMRQSRGFAGHCITSKICEKWVLQEPLTYLIEETEVTIENL